MPHPQETPGEVLAEFDTDTANAALQEAAQCDDEVVVAHEYRLMPVVQEVHRRLTAEAGFLLGAFALAGHLASARQRPDDLVGATKVALDLRAMRAEIETLPWPQGQTPSCDCCTLRVRDAIAGFADLDDGSNLSRSLYDLRPVLDAWLDFDDGDEANARLAGAVAKVILAALEATEVAS